MSTRSRIGGTSFSSSCAAKYYGPDATNTKSARILVAEREIVWLHALNLGPEDCIEILQVVGDQCVPYMPVPGICLEMDDCATSMALGVPGTYVMQINEEALGRVSVTASIDCDGENYLDWLKTFQEKHMSKKPFPYENECAPGVTDAKGALDFLLDQTKGIEDTDDQRASEVPIDDANGNFVGTNVEAALAELGADCADKEARLVALERGTVRSVAQNSDGDYVVTQFDGTTAILDDIDVPDISVFGNNNGTADLIVNGTSVGTFLTAGNQIVPNGDGTATITTTAGDTIIVDTDGDADTISPPWVANGDGTATVTDTDGVEHIVPIGGPDQNTTYAFTGNLDGSISVVGTDGTNFTSAPNTVDTDTFATLAGTVFTLANGDTFDVSSVDTDNQVLSSSNSSIIFTPTTQPDGQVDYDAVVNLFQDGGTGAPVPFNEVQPTLRDDCGDDLPKDTRVHTNLYPEAFTSGGSGADATDVIATQADPILYSSIESHTFTNPHPCRTFQGSFTIDQSITARFPADGGYGRIATEYRIDGGAWVTANTEGNNHEPGDDGDLKEFQLIDPQIPMALAPGASKLVEVRTRVQILFPTTTQQMELLSRATAIRGAFNAQ